MAKLNLPIRIYRYYPGDNPLGYHPKTIEIDTQQTALLLVDVYHAAEKQQAKHLVNTIWDRRWWEVVDNCIAPLIRSARSVELPIIYATNSSPRISTGSSAFGSVLRECLGFDPQKDFREPEVDPYEYDQGERVQLVIPPQVAPQPGDYYVRKHTYSGFFETRLDSVLRNLGARTLLCAGFVADVCMLFTLADAVFRGYQTVLMRDCTLATELPGEVENLAHTQRTILWMESFLGPSSTSEDFVVAAGQSVFKTDD